MDIGFFLTDLKSSQLISDPPKSLGLLLSGYNTTRSSLLDKHAPIVNKLSRRQSHQTHGLLLPSEHFGPSSAMLKTFGNVPTLLLTGPPSNLSTTNTTSSSCLPKKSTTPASCLQPPTTPNVFGKQSTNSYTRKSSSPLPTTSPGISLADSFASFFTGKISKLRLSLTNHPATSSPHSPSPAATPPNFSVFTSASEFEVYKILANCPNKQSDLDPIPTWLLKECSSFLVPTIINIVNLSLISGQFHPTLNESIISPLLKKPTLDKEELSNYRPIFNLSLISKVIKRVVKSRLMDHLTSNSLLNSHQSAYCKHHSTETALLYINDHLISAIGSQKVSCLCLLDLSLSAAFDT